MCGIDRRMCITHNTIRTLTKDTEPRPNNRQKQKFAPRPKSGENLEFEARKIWRKTGI